MTNDLIFVLKHKETGEYLNNIDTTSMIISFSNKPKQIFTSKDQFYRLFSRVERLRGQLAVNNEMKKMKTAAGYPFFDRQATKIKKILKQFDKCELKMLQIVDANGNEEYKEKIKQELFESAIRARLEYKIQDISSNRECAEIFAEALYKLREDPEQCVKYKFFVLTPMKTDLAINLLEEHGLDYKHIQTHKYKVFAFKSMKDINYLRLIFPKFASNLVEIKKLSSLEKRIIKKYNAAQAKQ